MMPHRQEESIPSLHQTAAATSAAQRPLVSAGR